MIQEKINKAIIIIALTIHKISNKNLISMLIKELKF